jgi:hypothetical protein
MAHSVVGLVSFAAIFGAALLGLFAARALPARLVNDQTHSTVTVTVAIVSPLAGLVLGLMTSAARSSFSNQSHSRCAQPARDDRLA